MSLDAPIRPGEERRAAAHLERVEAIEGLREQIRTLEEREPELRMEITELEKSQRTTLAELERTQRATVAALEKTHRTAIAELEEILRSKPENAEELADELARTRTELAEDLRRTRTELAEELARTRAELAEELACMRAELAAIGPALIEARCTLGMKMSDFALEEDEGHEQAIEYLKPLLVELHSTHRRALLAAERDAAEAEEWLRTLQAEHHDTADVALLLVEQRFQPLIDAEVIGVSVEQAKVRVARHQFALASALDPDPDEADPDDLDPRLARELELEAALDELDAARARASGLQEAKKAALYHYSHPTAEKGKRLGEHLVKRFGRHH
jgi:hypothetical protein